MATGGERPLRVLAADDSAVMRSMLRELFAAHGEDLSSELPRMELCGVTQDGAECLEAIERTRPDVLVLDLEMPKLNGLEVLDRLRRERPDLPVIMCSSHTEHGARATLDALVCGASDYVVKPCEQRNAALALVALSHRLLPRIAALAQEADRRRERLGDDAHGNEDHRSKVSRPKEQNLQNNAAVEVIVIGVSTGGPSALEQMLPQLTSDLPVPVLIAQHMPQVFTGALAERLDRCCALHVEQAYEDAPLRPGTIWLAPGGSHIEVVLKKTLDHNAGIAGKGRVRLHQQVLPNNCCPSVDLLFHSVARIYGAGVLALVMTGMGADGLNGAQAIYQQGGVVLAQDEASSAVWGMPGRVVKAGIASAVLPLGGIAEELLRRVNARRATKRMQRQSVPVGLLTRREAIYGLL
jgi:two-component system chemotaxis response regulator CheB